MNFKIQGLTPFVTVQPAPGGEPGPAFYVVRSSRPALPPLQRSGHLEGVAVEGTNECATPESGTRSATGRLGVRMGGAHGVHSGPTEKNSSRRLNLLFGQMGGRGLPVQEAKDKALLEPRCSGLLVRFRIVSFWQLRGPGWLPLVTEMS